MHAEPYAPEGLSKGGGYIYLEGYRRPPRFWMPPPKVVNHTPLAK